MVRTIGRHNNSQCVNSAKKFPLAEFFTLQKLRQGEIFCAHNSNYIAKESAPARDGFFMNMSVKL